MLAAPLGFLNVILEIGARPRVIGNLVKLASDVADIDLCATKACVGEIKDPQHPFKGRLVLGERVGQANFIRHL